MKLLTPNKKQKKRRNRRSERRLGSPDQQTPNKTVMENAVAQSPLAVEPALAYWKVNGSRIIGFMVLLLCVWIIYLLFDFDSFYIYGANINGNRILSTQEIYQASEIDTLSVFWVNPNQIKRNLESLPNIKTADIKVTLPANINITVEERHPEVIWQTADRIWWIDNEGTFIPPRQDIEDIQDRLHIIDSDSRPVQSDDKIDLAIIRGSQIIHENKPEINQLLYTKAFGLVYITPEGWPVYMGKSDNMQAKLIIADAVRADLLARSVIPVFIDVRNPLRAVYEEKRME